jgi:hypothetical protein
MRKLLLPLATALALLGGFSVALTARYVSNHTPVTPAPEVPVSAQAAERLAGAIRIRTISAEDATALMRRHSGRFTRTWSARFPSCTRDCNARSWEATASSIRGAGLIRR